ncbi:MAG: putative transcriptional regulatory protein [Phycisphaeraceae bacterium]|nr:MAG: putative transcriptional regulatory protein [Phycisphaeraceae bacterium]
MAGHSKWANIRHRKERQDKKKGAMWSKCSTALMAAARQGGPDPDTNLALRYAIDEAKYANMPKDTIKRAIEKGAGAGQGDAYIEVTFEGYGPGGTAILVDCLTDNNTRTVGDVRSIFKKGGGSMGTSGSVSFMFQTKGQIIIAAEGLDADTVMEQAIEAGAEDVQMPEPEGDDAGAFTIVTEPTDFLSVKDALEVAGLTIAEATIAKIPDNTVEIAGDDARKLMNLLDSLEDNEDVQKVYSNADIPDDVLEALG